MKFCVSIGHEDLEAQGEALIDTEDEEGWEWFPYCEDCLNTFFRAGDSTRFWEAKVDVGQMEWRINSPVLGAWPEVFCKFGDALGDLAYVRETYPDREFWLEERMVGEWTKSPE